MNIFQTDPFKRKSESLIWFSNYATKSVLKAGVDSKKVDLASLKPETDRFHM